MPRRRPRCCGQFSQRVRGGLIGPLRTKLRRSEFAVSASRAESSEDEENLPMSRATIAALSLLLAEGSPACALADADQSAPAGCLTYEMATEAATRALENDPDGRLMLFAGLDAAALLKAINDQPPQTDFRADHILVVQRAAQDNVQIGLIVDGCFRGPFAMKEADWEKLKAAVAEQFSS